MFKTTSHSECPKNNPKKYYLSDEEKNFYAKNGYLVIKKLFDEETLDSFKQRFLEICNGKALRQSCTVIPDKRLASTSSNPEDYIFKIQDILNDPIFMRYSEDPRLLHITSQFIGEELTALNCMLINKPPASTRHPSHQDAYYFPIRPMTVLAAWTAIDATTKANGCLYFVPGSHKLELQPHEVFKDAKKFFHSIADEARLAPEHKRLYLEMSPGDTVLFHPHLVHGSGDNTTRSHRKAMTCHFMSSSCQFIDLTGTGQDSILADFLRLQTKKNGTPESYQAFFKLRSKVVKGSRSHL